TAAKPAPRGAAAACANCGVVVAVRESKQAGEGTGLGAVAGGVIGGVVGHQFGGGRGKDALTVAGAVGGAVAGHQLEKQARAKTVYHVDVKMNDGTLRTFDYGTPPGLAVGAKVEVNGEQLSVRG
ncbi:MAG TPA: glycine zipper 2TM domain-containing protein, partial [Burkholderiaceae bacterium]|nr:glycine zipper 2TM domain-containing protein [Burkholderiaceae bacterium]